MKVYQKYSQDLSDSRQNKQDMKRLYIMDSMTISLFKAILEGVGRNSKTGKREGEIKAHTIIKAEEDVPCLILYSAAVGHDHTFLQEVDLPKDSIITFDKSYVDYGQYQKFSEFKIWYVTCLKSNAKYVAKREFEIPDDADSGIIKDELIDLEFGGKDKKIHKARRIA